jgi:hypothetical protein
MKGAESGEPAAEPLDPLPDLVRDLAQGGEVGRAEMRCQLREQGIEIDPAFLKLRTREFRTTFPMWTRS